MKIQKIRKLIYKLLNIFDKIIGKNHPNIIVLCYHSIASDNWRFSIDIETFKNQIEKLSKNYTFVSAVDLENYLTQGTTLPKKSALITFDDGYKNMLYAKDFLKQLNIKPLLFVLATPLQADQSILKSDVPMLSNAELRELINAGWTIGSHTATHRDLLTLNENELKQEISNSKTLLENDLGVSIDYFSYPKGRYNNNVMQITKDSGYKLAFSMNDNIITNKTSKYEIPRIGLDKSHNLNEFESTFSTSVIMFRQIVKNFLGKNLDKTLNI